MKAGKESFFLTRMLDRGNNGGVDGVLALRLSAFCFAVLVKRFLFCRSG
jgi:hypothetical protein